MDLLGTLRRKPRFPTCSLGPWRGYAAVWAMYCEKHRPLRLDSLRTALLRLPPSLVKLLPLHLQI